MAHVTWPRPFHGRFVRRLVLTMINLSTKLKSLCSPNTKIWKATQKLGWFGVLV